MKPTSQSLPEQQEFDIPALRIKLFEGLGSHSADYPHQLEKQFPRILAKVVELWGSEVLEPYLDRLSFTDRPDRGGFPPEVARELFKLGAAHQALGLSPATKSSAWIDDDSPDARGRSRRG